MRTFDQFEALTDTEVATINGGGTFDGLVNGLGNLFTGAGNALTGIGGISTGAGNALTLLGAGAGSTLNFTGIAIGAIGTGLGVLIAGIKLPV
ncbi:hypothetical protein [Paraflavitalea speifideaquila]|uniref:hypothetical protein n=1 Tax=Paraflavitalea speifideaquila TaxID=3076558 RepID=UPI0028E53DB2|nr:hypothetical protein [Paraflavitalea speifideiaquila]